LDFGFAIHSQVGLRTIGAKVNGKLVPISQELRNGDIVEIITTAKDRASNDWLNQVKTGRAKGKIRDFLKSQRNRLSVQGKEIIERLLRKHRFELNESSAQKLTRHFGYLNPSEFYHAAASGSIKINKALLISILTKTSSTEGAENKEQVASAVEQKLKKAPKQQIIIGDDHDLPYELAKCCHPLPGDSIFGFITIGEGVKIHRTTCPNATKLMSQYGYRIIPAKWKDESYDKSFAARIQVNGIDDVGLVSRLTEIISRDMAVNMKSIHIESDGKGSFSGWIEVMINNLNHLTLLIQNMKEAHKYIEVKRLDEA
jgi:guanosine-3',5'-bis(diphosphate) 3'-pyrophosphohydrolase